ncbi:MAG: hypothetical protein U0746_21190 [Gemmataceae bacterium]
MLLEPQPTRYDLNFDLFGTPVRVHPWFWIFTAILGWSAIDNDNPLLHLFVWIVAVFLSILLHEFGHIWMGKLFRSDGYIVLYSFGGLAIGSADVRYRWQRILVSLAGPAIQLVLWLALYGILYLGGAPWLGRQSDLMLFLYEQLWYINLFWPLLNLLPVWPLDGGQVCREVCSIFVPRDGQRVSLMVSVGVAGLLAINGFMGANGRGFLPYVPTGRYTAFLFAILAVESWMLLQQSNRPWRYESADDRMPWER